MLLTDHFVFIHIFRTGGTWVREVLKSSKKEWNSQNIVGHYGYVEVPEECQELPAFAFVRNPWDWYVSWYEYVVACINRDEMAPAEDKWMELVGRRNHGPQPFQESFERQLAFHRGSFSAQVQHFITDAQGEERVKLYRYENLRTELLRALEDAGASVSARLRHAIEHARPRNGSHRQPLSQYYTSQMRERVREVDAHLIERFGYVCPF